MDQLQPPTTSYRRLHLATVWICIVSIIATLAATAIEQFYFKTGASLIIGGCGLVAAIPFAVVWSLSFLGRHRLCPATVALLAAIAGCCLALLLFGSWCHELAEVISTGTSSYRRPGDRFNSRGIEFLLVAVYEWVIGVPAFLLLYGLGWLISRVPKKGEKGVGSGSGVGREWFRMNEIAYKRTRAATSSREEPPNHPFHQTGAARRHRATRSNCSGPGW